MLIFLRRAIGTCCMVVILFSCKTAIETHLVFFFFVPLLSVFFDLELDFFGAGWSVGNPAFRTKNGQKINLK